MMKMQLDHNKSLADELRSKFDTKVDVSMEKKVESLELVFNKSQQEWKFQH
jgi:hypothetical protein